ncbi:MAG: hypothetical protein ABWY92_24710 [Xanthobacteraceae bacterium]
MGRARLRASDEVDDLGEHKHSPYQLGRMLRGVHDELGLWQRCRHKACKRARRCRADVDLCARHSAGVSAWLEGGMKIEGAGLSTEETSQRAAAPVWGGHSQAPSAPAQRAAQR